MDIDLQRSTTTEQDLVDAAREPDEAPNAWDVLKDHIPNSTNGCCNKCGRPWDAAAGRCDAPEVLLALAVLRSRNGRPDYRVGGGNRGPSNQYTWA